MRLGSHPCHLFFLPLFSCSQHKKEWMYDAVSIWKKKETNPSWYMRGTGLCGLLPCLEVSCKEKKRQRCSRGRPHGHKEFPLFFCFPSPAIPWRSPRRCEHSPLSFLFFPTFSDWMSACGGRWALRSLARAPAGITTAARDAQAWRRPRSAALCPRRRRRSKRWKSRRLKRPGRGQSA